MAAELGSDAGDRLVAMRAPEGDDEPAIIETASLSAATN
jgi:hypothetical protein